MKEAVLGWAPSRNAAMPLRGFPFLSAARAAPAPSEHATPRRETRGSTALALAAAEAAATAESEPEAACQDSTPVAAATSVRTRRSSSTAPSRRVAKASERSADEVDSGPAFFPFQLTDEMYAHILRKPAAFDYPELPVGAVQLPKFGHIYVEQRHPADRRPKLVDGYDWVPSSTANASSRVLRDGRTELLRFYCARRTKADEAKPMEKPFVTFQRAVYDEMRDELGHPSTYDLKRAIGQRWQEMTAPEKAPWQTEARANNRLIRQRMAKADPAQLLVRHEMWLRQVGKDDDDVNRVLIHYLGDDAFQLLSLPPRPMHALPRGTPDPTAGAGAVNGGADDAASSAYTLRASVETRDVQLFLGSLGVVSSAGAGASTRASGSSGGSSASEGDEDGVEDEGEDDDEELFGLPPLSTLAATAATGATTSSTSYIRMPAIGRPPPPAAPTPKAMPQMPPGPTGASPLFTPSLAPPNAARQSSARPSPRASRLAEWGSACTLFDGVLDMISPSRSATDDAATVRMRDEEAHRSRSKERDEDDEDHERELSETLSPVTNEWLELFASPKTTPPLRAPTPLQQTTHDIAAHAAHDDTEASPEAQPLLAPSPHDDVAPARLSPLWGVVCPAGFFRGHGDD